jgi:hypothetical protein
MSTVRPPLKEAIELGLYSMAYFAAVIILILPLTIIQFIKSAQRTNSISTRLLLFACGASNLLIAIWIPRLTWEVVGFVE